MHTITNEKVLEFLKKTAIMSIAVNTDLVPISSVVLFTINDDFTLYFATHDTSFKARALIKDVHISFCCWKNNKMLVQGAGIAKKIVKEKNINNILDRLANGSVNLEEFWPPVLHLKGKAYAVFKIKTTWLRIFDLTKDVIREKDEPIYEIKL